MGAGHVMRRKKAFQREQHGTYQGPGAGEAMGRRGWDVVRDGEAGLGELDLTGP